MRKNQAIHLHSTMYLFQLYIIKNLNIQVIIYIPLCIYFNPLALSAFKCSLIKFTFHYVSISTLFYIHMQLGRVYLHSTMYLFQPGVSLGIIGGAVFTFHYVSISTIYRLAPAIHLDRFTFHYVSISTAMFVEFGTGTVGFTFHYVSISTSHREVFFPYYFDLHSTMYLFQPAFVVCVKS